MKNDELINSLLNMATRLDHELASEFLKSSLEVAEAHFDLIKSTLSEREQIRQQRQITQGYILLILINHATGCTRIFNST